MLPPRLALDSCCFSLIRGSASPMVASAIPKRCEALRSGCASPGERSAEVIARKSAKQTHNPARVRSGPRDPSFWRKSRRAACQDRLTATGPRRKMRMCAPLNSSDPNKTEIASSKSRNKPANAEIKAMSVFWPNLDFGELLIASLFMAARRKLAFSKGRRIHPQISTLDLRSSRRTIGARSPAPRTSLSKDPCTCHSK